MGDGKRGRGSPAVAIAATALSIFAIAAVVLAAQGVAAFQGREDDPPPPADVTTTVRADSLVDTVTADVRLVPGMTWAVESDGIVTRAGVQAGAVLSSGDAIGVVDERPVFLLAGAVPMYRGLGPGSVGDDVKQLQTALAALGYYDYVADGKYEKGTARAVYDFYVGRGFAAVDSAGEAISSAQKADAAQREAASIPQEELTFAPGGTAVAVTSCGNLAQKVAGKLCELQSGGSAVVVSVDSVDEARVKAGQSVEVVVGSDTFPGTIGDRYDVVDQGDVAAEDGTTSSGEAGGESDDTGIDFVIDHEQPVSPTPDATGKATIVVDSSVEGALVVESVAIREDAAGALWLQAAGTHARIDIASGLCLRGLCVVEGEGVEEGLDVVVLVPGSTTRDEDTS
ncbi:peptidoglycan-binding protein [Streptomyces sp. AC495_CC817]|uniref:peptidoglycan-binding domain-containing protein n=1 Tax=Streptomyces sp. AC495_CC817 TaxID=2823900 RepID=UPI001C2670B9|nr:peptidoglycan-binding domain-containing protein [Streptomyces sp. AC495_CC817]